MDELIFYGSAIKAMGEGRVAGHLVLFSTESDPDLTGEYFTKNTDFDFEDGDKTTVLYHHGLDPMIGKKSIGKGTMSRDDVGIWVDAQLNMRNEYEKSIYELAEQGKLGWSSGTLAHRVEKETTGKATWIKSWALGLDASLTPTPAEPRTKAVTLKSLLPDQDQAAELQEEQSEAQGMTLHQQTEEVITTLQAFAERIAGYSELKAKDNRKVSGAKHAEWKAIRDQIDGIIAKVEAPDRLKAMKLRLMREKLNR